MGSRLLPAVCAGLLCALLVGCAASGSAPAGSQEPAGRTAPPIAEVEPAADPRAFSGPLVAGIDDPGVQPVESGEPDLPAVVRDAQDSRVTVTDTSRVLALDLHGTLSRTVFELGQGERLVGRDLSTQFDEAADLPLVTGKGHELNAEAILGLDPTLILTDTSLGPWDVVLQMRDAGIPVVVVEADRSLDNVGAISEMVGAALGVPDAGRELGEREERQVAEVTATIAAKAPPERERLRTVFLYIRGGAGVYYMFGEGSGADDMIAAAGAYDVAAEIGWKGMRPVTAEGLVAAAPELVVMMNGGLQSVDGVDGLLEALPALAQTPAGQNKRIIAMEDSLLLGYGPTTSEVLDALAVAVLAPEELG